MNIEIANRLVNLRKANNLSQEALAEKLGISRQAVSKWERAEASPDTDNLILLARLYGVSLDELLKTEDEIPMPESSEQSMETVLAEHPGTEASRDIFRERYSEKEDWEKGERYGRFWIPRLRHFPMWIVVSILYIAIGVGWNAWHPGWLLFLLVPIWHSLVAAVERKNANCFAYPVFVTLVYLCLGFFGFFWHPGWVVYLTIPLYYSLISWYRGNREEDEEDDEE